METALFALQQGNVYVGLLQEPKLTQCIHIRNGKGTTSCQQGRRFGIGGSISGLESGKGMAGGVHGQLWSQRGEFSTNVGVNKMVHCSGICAPKQRTICA